MRRAYSSQSHRLALPQLEFELCCILQSEFLLSQNALAGASNGDQCVVMHTIDFSASPASLVPKTWWHCLGLRRHKH